MEKVFIAGTSRYYWPHAEFGELETDLSVLKNSPSSIKLVVLIGGSDINPTIYGHKRNRKSYCILTDDQHDLRVFNIAQKNGIPCVGICRGGQFLVAQAGGFLYQHVTGHHSDHEIQTLDGNIFTVSSSHHQMFGLPLPPKSILLAWSRYRLSKTYELDIQTTPPQVEPEIVYHPHIKSLSVQYHPEWMSKESLGVRYYQKIIRTELLGNKTMKGKF